MAHVNTPPLHGAQRLFAGNPESDLLVANVTSTVKELMSRPPFDSSHDFSHVSRVVSMAKHLATSQHADDTPVDELLVILAALLHDVDDHKYATPGPKADLGSAESILLSYSATPSLARTVQAIVSHVSCSFEIANPEAVAALRRKHPELAIVQDADRLDAIGALGVGRAFTFGGAHNRSINSTMGEFDRRLLRRETMINTPEGRRIASKRCQRLREFMAWWNEESC